jgi:hypothetical protein
MFEIGRVMNSRIFDSLPEFVNFIGKLGPLPEVDVEKGKLEIRRNWYFDELDGKRVVGVDGSQLRHLKEFGIPFGAVQVARFSVIHGSGAYDVAYKSKWVGLESNLEYERFSVEMESLIDEMDGKSYLFYDGSLVLSFVSQLRKDLREGYVNSINLMLERSEETSTPIFGFVEKSYARDISESHYDSLILRDTLKPFEYTVPKVCGREVLGYLGYSRKIYFSYLSLNKLFPVRVEFPEWMVEDVEALMRLVAAECMLGSTKNYPYVLERAHRYAVIREAEREVIGRMFSRGNVSLKWISKRGRI